MTLEDRELVLKDLCARLPYHPILNWKFIDNISKDEELKELSDLYIWWITKAQDCEIKPYFRPMFSITDEEKEEIKPFFSELRDETGRRVLVVRQNEMSLYQDYLNAHFLDYRGLIPKGLALEAPEGMYKVGRE